MSPTRYNSRRLYISPNCKSPSNLTISISRFHTDKHLLRDYTKITRASLARLERLCDNNASRAHYYLSDLEDQYVSFAWYADKS
jgi:hypothetical protein